MSGPPPDKRPPELAAILIETALDAYRDALILAFEAHPIDELRATVESTRPSVHTVLELARPRLPQTTPRPSRRARRAQAAQERKR